MEKIDIQTLDKKYQKGEPLTISELKFLADKQEEIKMENLIFETYQRFQKGDPLTTPKLDFFADYMRRVEELLIKIGPEFNIVRTHVTMQKIGAETFLNNRENYG